jgi:hypothetical protein
MKGYHIQPQTFILPPHEILGRTFVADHTGDTHQLRQRLDHFIPQSV